MPTVPKQGSVLGKDPDRAPYSGPPPLESQPSQPDQLYMLMAAATMKDLGRLYKPVAIPVPGILSKVRAEYWSQAERETPKEVREPATLVEKPQQVAENK